jgi:hypothetical protein
MSDVYECTLPQSQRVSVQPGDIVGIETAAFNRYKFGLHFDNSHGPTNRIFNELSLQTINLNQDVGTEEAQPLISLTVERTVEVVPTTQSLASTSPATEMTVNTESDLDTTQPLVTTSPATEMTDNTDLDTTQPLVTTSVATEMTVNTEPDLDTTQPLVTTAPAIEMTVNTDLDTTELTGTTTVGTLTTQISMTDNGIMSTVMSSEPTSTKIKSISTNDPTTPKTKSEDDLTTTISSRLSGDASNQKEDNNNIGIYVAIVGGIVAISLAFVVVVLLTLILRRQRGRQKISANGTRASNIANPIYNGKLNMQSSVVLTL